MLNYLWASAKLHQLHWLVSYIWAPSRVTEKNLHEQYFKNFGNREDRGIKKNSLLKTELVENNSVCLP